MTNVITNLVASILVDLAGIPPWEGYGTNSAAFTSDHLTTAECVAYTTEDRVKDLAESGEICKVYGHWWEMWQYPSHDNGDGTVTVPLVHIPDPPDKQCRLCGATARRKLVVEGEKQ